MKSGLLALGICSALTAHATHAQPAPLRLAAANRVGYAFDSPAILVRQELFGLAHGVSLLAYQRWQTQQAFTIKQIEDELGRWHFGPRAANASWADIARAIGLKRELAATDEDIRSACTTLPDALPQPRYELKRLLEAATAVSPAPTIATDTRPSP